MSLATDLGIGVPLEHGLHSTLVGMRLCERLGVDPETASQTYYGCLLFYVGCTAPADIGLEVFGGEDALTKYATPTRYGSRPEVVAGMLRALAPPRDDGRGLSHPVYSYTDAGVRAFLAARAHRPSRA